MLERPLHRDRRRRAGSLRQCSSTQSQLGEIKMHHDDLMDSLYPDRERRADTYLDLFEDVIEADILDQIIDQAADCEGFDENDALRFSKEKLKSKMMTAAREAVAADPLLSDLLLRPEKITF
jgi:hypothetical protein